MSKILPLIFCLIAIHTQARIKPAEGSKLNYVMVGFMADEKAGISRYRLQVAEGNYTDEKQFAQHVIIDKKLSTNRTIEELPRFGASYTWRMTYLNDKGKAKGETQLFHFATDTCPSVDTSLHRLKVISNKMGNSELMVTTDFRAVLYNLDGKPLWFLPPIEKFGRRLHLLRDLKPTPQGTFTCLYGFNAIEVDYDGNLIWEGPDNGKVNGDTAEYYHHELTRLSNGHYMVCGDEIWWAKPDSILYGSKDMPKDIEIQARKGRNYRRYMFGTLIEYDSLGNVIWYWKSKEHFMKYEHVPVAIKPKYTGFTHLNSFFFDEKDSAIYMSFRDINRVVKIKYPTGEWLNSYGDKYASDTVDPSCDLFCGQHCVRTTDGELYLFDNHALRGEDKLLSYISIYREPETTDKKANLTKTWTFPCDMDSGATAGTSTGGGVYMLPDKTLLCTMGAAGRLFVVNRNKEVLWNAISQQRPSNRDKLWRNSAEYRVYPIVNKADLERFIFH